MNFTTHTLQSADGTKIGYRQAGNGPGLVICHGAARISQSYARLAEVLAPHYTVYIPDRRGRGLSGPEGPGYGIRQAVADLAAILQHTGAQFVFGHSAGAMIALETMLQHPVNGLAIYEPPVSVNGSFPLNWLPAFEKLLLQGRRKRAMAVELKGLNVVEGMGNMPLWLITLLIRVLCLAESNKQKGTRMLDLLDTLPADIRMVQALDGQADRYRALQLPILMMAGAKSPVYFRSGLQVLSGVIPAAQTRIFEGFDHYSPEEQVQELAHALGQFFNSAAVKTSPAVSC